MSFSGAGSPTYRRSNGSAKVYEPSTMPATMAELNTMIAGMAGTIGQRQGGGRIVLPHGYLEAETPMITRNHVFVEGTSTSGTVIQSDFSSDYMVKQFSTADRRFGVRNMTLEGNYTNTHGIHINTPAGGAEEYDDGMVKCTDLFLVGVRDALVIEGRGDGRYRDIDIRDCNRGVVIPGVDNTLSGIMIGGADSYGIDWSGANNRFSDCKAYYTGLEGGATGHAWYLHGDAVHGSMANCEGQDAVGHNLYVEGFYFFSIANFIADSGGAGHNSQTFAGSGVVLHNCDNIVLSGLQARNRNVNPTQQQYGLVMTGWTDNVFYTMMATGNALGDLLDTASGTNIRGSINGAAIA